ncbi:Retrovirus-related Pol polyprotein from transposon TNT 1-94 [Vitis vinifera]|uniref:Retrovirus-related Pol polyprotein from transposon TNT 1-94 n=1 Tax=Vitis vinifera TaxID=29760 RepID=A0A438C103_VITVI|nr:Retrovirus-related Pol polyprotein from transposon TNT 1-94 [Vitis vinifera]
MKDPEDIAAYRKSIERQRVHIFLAGLGESDNPDTSAMVVRQQLTRNWQDQSKTNHPKTDHNIDKSTFKCTHYNKTGHTKSRCFEIVGYPDWWDHNRDQQKKNSKKTSTAAIAEIKTEANVDEKASALIAATDYGDKSHPLDLPHKNLFPQPMDIQTRQTIGFGIKRGKLYYLDLQSNDSNKLRQALMADGSEEEKKKMTWLYLMKTKDEVNLLFQKFHKMIETQYNAKVRVLRSDNGGEYQSSDLQKYLEGHGIIHQTTCSNTPQQNGVVERKNRHLLEVFRASLIAAKTPISYWGEAITSAVYLINRVPSSSINFQTPLQALTNVVVAPTVPNLPPRVFGCVAFVHLHKHQRTKVNFPCIAMCVCWICIAQKGISMLPSSNSTNGEYHKEIQTLDYDYHISKENESGQSELVNQEVGELDMRGQQFGSEDVFTEISNQSSSVEGVLNLEPDPFMKRLPHRHNLGIPKPTYEPDLSTKVKYPMSNYVSNHRLSESNKSFVNQLFTVVIPNNVQEALVDPRWKVRLVSRYPHQSCLKSSILKNFRQVGHV